MDTMCWICHLWLPLRSLSRDRRPHRRPWCRQCYNAHRERHPDGPTYARRILALCRHWDDRRPPVHYNDTGGEKTYGWPRSCGYSPGRAPTPAELAVLKRRGDQYAERKTVHELRRYYAPPVVCEYCYGTGHGVRHQHERAKLDPFTLPIPPPLFGPKLAAVIAKQNSSQCLWCGGSGEGLLPLEYAYHPELEPEQC